MWVEWSDDNGKTWTLIEVPSTAPLHAYKHSGKPELWPFHDGTGNVYRDPLENVTTHTTVVDGGGPTTEDLVYDG